MTRQSIVASTFMGIAAVLGILFYQNIDVPTEPGGYFEASYYGQFGPLAICVELLIAGLYLLRSHRGANFALALFSFTALIDVLLGAIGWYDSQVPNYGRMLFVLCALVSLRLVQRNTFDLKPISWPMVFLSFVLGLAIDLYFNRMQLML